MVPLAMELDGRRARNIGMGEYTRVEVPAGRHSISPYNGYWTRVTFGIPHPVEVQVRRKAYYLVPKKSGGKHKIRSQGNRHHGRGGEDRR